MWHQSIKPAYLTIDDGPSLHRPHKLTVLQEMGIPAVFFSEGRWLEVRPELALQTIKAGFALGNHGFSHQHFSSLPLNECCAEIAKTDEIIHAIYCASGQPQHPRFFRFPYGDKGDGRFGRVFSLVKKKDEKRHRYLQDFLKELGYQPPNLAGISHRFYQKAGLHEDMDWHWTFDVMEWAVFQKKQPNGMDSLEKLVQRMRSTCPADTRGRLWWSKRWLGNQGGSEIILMHDHDETGELFKPLLEALVQLPIQFKALEHDLLRQGQNSV